MRLQRVLIETNHVIWLVLDDNYLPIKPILDFIRFLDNIEKSPNTIRAYAHHLKLYWEYLDDIKKDWNVVKLDDLAGFIGWLRTIDPNLIELSPQKAQRTETTINTILGCLSSFYDFHQQLGNTTFTLTKLATKSSACRYKPLLHYLNRYKPIKSRLLSLRQFKKFPKTLEVQQIKALINACQNLRDKFLISLLYETGMRIGQALGLKHEDIRSFDNEIHLVPRPYLANEARSKSKKTYIIHVSTDLMKLYSHYVIEECHFAESDYVFIQTKKIYPGKPLNYRAVRDVFCRLSQKVGFHVTPHMLRHTHATELIRAGWDASYVQKRLGHASIQTTLNIYSHLTQADLKKAFLDYQTHKEKKNNDKISH